MSKADIIAELPKLTAKDRQEVRLRLAELDADDWLDDGELTDTEKIVIEERFRDLETNPHLSIPWKNRF